MATPVLSRYPGKHLYAPLSLWTSANSAKKSFFTENKKNRFPFRKTGLATSFNFSVALAVAAVASSSAADVLHAVPSPDPAATRCHSACIREGQWFVLGWCSPEKY